VLFFTYIVRNVRARLRTNAITMLSVALFVAAASLGVAFYRSLAAMLVESAPANVVLVLAEGAPEEAESVLELETARKLSLLDGIRAQGSVRLVTQEALTRVYLNPSRFDRYDEPAPIRGIDEASFEVHRAKLVKGTLPAAGSLDVVLGRQVAAQYPNLAIGSQIFLPGGPARVTGVFSAGGSPHEQEVWTWRAALDVHFNKKVLSSVTFVAESSERAAQLVAEINRSKDLDAQAAPLATYRSTGAGLRAIVPTVLLMLISLSLVATFVIATTMSAAVATRMPELAALAAMGIRKSLLARMVIVESAFVALAGAVVGVLASELVRRVVERVPLGENPLTLTTAVPWIGIVLGLVVGLVGGLAPALRVRRLSIVESLR
jgi:putative ABC transport system permease protein